MSLTPSNMLALGTKAPNFTLPDTVSGNNLSYDDIAGEAGTVVMFICNHCPYVIHVNSQLVSLAIEFEEKGIGFVAISSNDVENYPDDSPEKMTTHAKKEGYPFPYLYDESQSAAKDYDAACTPDFYVFDNEKTLVYRGRLDESSPGNGKALTGADLRASLDSMIYDKPQTDNQIPSMGCNIKWK